MVQNDLYHHTLPLGIGSSHSINLLTLGLHRNLCISTKIVCDKIYTMSKMIRTNYYYPQPMLDALKVASNKHGLPASEIIRRAITEWLKCN